MIWLFFSIQFDETFTFHVFFFFFSFKMFNVKKVGFSTAYIIFIAQNMCLMTDIAWRWFVLILFIPCLLSCFITKLKVLAPFAFFGSICILVGLAVVLWFCLVEKRSQFEESLNKETLLAFDYTTLPIWFGIVVYGEDLFSIPILPLLTFSKQKQISF